jgi:hypothetical protein
MSRLCVLICRIDEEDGAEQLTELACVEIPSQVSGPPGKQVDQLEEAAVQVGQQLLGRLVELQWEELDARAVARYRQGRPQVIADGYQPLQVATRYGTLQLRRQVCAHPDGSHVMPGNALLPEHGGMLITRGLAEWACLLSQDLPFATAARLLGWQAGEAGVLSPSMLRTLVRDHGQRIRQVEYSRARRLLERREEGGCRLRGLPPAPARRRPGWPEALSAAVEAALARGQDWPPEGVSRADWARVLTARRAEHELGAAELRVLGPTLAPGQVLLALDEVLTPARAPGQFHELRTACLLTHDARRYLSGVGDTFLVQVLALVRACQGRSLLVLADGARWIRTFFERSLAYLPQASLLLDWHHLKEKCRDLIGRLAPTRPAKLRLVQRVLCRLWRGEVPRALRLLEAYRPHARNQSALDELLGYLRARAPWIPNYRERRRQCEYIGSGLVEQANDRIVARRQKSGGMRWSARGSVTLATLRTLVLNGGWDTYWRQWELAPTCAAA